MADQVAAQVEPAAYPKPMFKGHPDADIALVARGIVFRARLSYLEALAQLFEDASTVAKSQQDEQVDGLPMIKVDATPHALDIVLCLVHKVALPPHLPVDNLLEAFELAHMWIAPTLVDQLRSRLPVDNNLYVAEIWKVATKLEDEALMRASVRSTYSQTFTMDPALRRQEWGTEGYIISTNFHLQNLQMYTRCIEEFYAALSFYASKHTYKIGPILYRFNQFAVLQQQNRFEIWPTPMAFDHLTRALLKLTTEEDCDKEVRTALEGLHARVLSWQLKFDAVREGKRATIQTQNWEKIARLVDGEPGALEQFQMDLRSIYSCPYGQHRDYKEDVWPCVVELFSRRVEEWRDQMSRI